MVVKIKEFVCTRYFLCFILRCVFYIFKNNRVSGQNHGVFHLPSPLTRDLNFNLTFTFTSFFNTIPPIHWGVNPTFSSS